MWILAVELVMLSTLAGSPERTGEWPEAKSYTIVQGGDAPEILNVPVMARRIRRRTGLEYVALPATAEAEAVRCGLQLDCVRALVNQADAVLLVVVDEGRAQVRLFDAHRAHGYLASSDLAAGTPRMLHDAIESLFPDEVWDATAVLHISTGSVRAIATVGALDCETPCSLRLERRIHSLEISAVGYDKFEDTVDLLHNDEARIEAELTGESVFHAHGYAVVAGGFAIQSVLQPPAVGPEPVDAAGAMDARAGFTWNRDLRVLARIGGAYAVRPDIGSSFNRAVYASPALLVGVSPGRLLTRDHLEFRAGFGLPGEAGLPEYQAAAASATGRWDDHLWRSRAFFVTLGGDVQVPTSVVDVRLEVDFSTLIPSEDRSGGYDFGRGLGGQFGLEVSKPLGPVRLGLRQQVAWRTELAFVAAEYWLLSHQVLAELALGKIQSLTLKLNFNTAAEPDLTGGLGVALGWALTP